MGEEGGSSTTDTGSIFSVFRSGFELASDCLIVVPFLLFDVCNPPVLSTRCCHDVEKHLSPPQSGFYHGVQSLVFCFLFLFFFIFDGAGAENK